MVEEIADTLEEYAEFLRLDGQEGRAHAYEKAARSLRIAGYAPPNPARLDGIGDATRETIIDVENGMEIDELEELKDEYSWYAEFGQVKHVGPSRAKQLHETFNISTLDKLEIVARNGDLQMVSGIGSATAEKIKKSIEEVK